MVCHAPAILRDAKKPNGEALVKGLTVTGFMNAEDDELELDDDDDDEDLVVFTAKEAAGAMATVG